MTRRSDPAQTVIDYINTLEEFRFRSPDLPYDRMGATPTDAILDAGLRYDSVVVPRVQRVGKIAKARTTTGFLSVLEQRGAASLLSWNDAVKPNRLVSLTHFLANHEIETEIGPGGVVEGCLCARHDFGRAKPSRPRRGQLKSSANTLPEASASPEEECTSEEGLGQEDGNDDGDPREGVQEGRHRSRLGHRCGS